MEPLRLFSQPSGYFVLHESLSRDRDRHPGLVIGRDDILRRQRTVLPHVGTQISFTGSLMTSYFERSAGSVNTPESSRPPAIRSANFPGPVAEENPLFCEGNTPLSPQEKRFPALLLSLFSVDPAMAQESRIPDDASNFYKSDGVTMPPVTFPNQYKMTIAGNLFVPEGINPEFS